MKATNFSQGIGQFFQSERCFQIFFAAQAYFFTFALCFGKGTVSFVIWSDKSGYGQMLESSPERGPLALPIAIGRLEHLTHNQRVHQSSGYRQRNFLCMGEVVRSAAIVYILYSSSLDKYYIGFTTSSPEERLERHLGHYYGTAFTGEASDWILYWEMICEHESQARKIERHIKKMKSKAYIQNLARFPEIAEKLLMKYR